jgi:hypothetical protein
VWYEHRLSEIEREINKSYHTQSQCEALLREAAQSNARIEPPVVEAGTRVMRDALMAELKLLRYSAFRHMMANNQYIEKHELSMSEGAIQRERNEHLLTQTLAAEKEIVKILNDPEKLLRKTREFLIEARGY